MGCGFWGSILSPTPPLFYSLAPGPNSGVHLTYPNGHGYDFGPHRQRGHPASRNPHFFLPVLTISRGEHPIVEILYARDPAPSGESAGVPARDASLLSY